MPKKKSIEISFVTPGSRGFFVFCPYIFKTFQCNALYREEVQCNSMNKIVDLCSAVECTAAHPRLTKSTEEEEKALYIFFSVSVLLLASVEKFGVPLPRQVQRLWYLLTSTTCNRKFEVNSPI